MKRKLHNINTWMLLLLMLSITQAIARGQQYASAVMHDKAGQEQQAGKGNKALLRDLLFTLEGAYTVRFNYDDEAVGDLIPGEGFTWHKKERIEKVLRRLVSPLNLQFEKQDKNNYLIYPAPTNDPSGGSVPGQGQTANKTIPPLSGADTKFIQPVARPAQYFLAVTVSGTVTDDTGGPLPGVNVLVKGTTVGTTTDNNGKYTIEVADNNAVLVFSFIGYLTEEVQINSRSVIDLSLIPDITTLSEIVVVGYGEQKRADLTSSIASVSTKEIENIPTVSVESALQGRMAGVQIVTNSGRPGASSFVRIRGNSTLIGANEPLIVIDGVPVSNEVRVGNNLLGSEDGVYSSVLGTLNPNDIESIDVLKDAAATAIWGARGSGGVIMITTKRGKAGAGTSLSFNGYYGLSAFQRERKLKMLNADEYLAYVESARLNTNSLGGAQTAPDVAFQNTANLGNDTDWQEEIFRTGAVSNYDLSAQGGDDKTQFFISGGVFNQEGIVIGSGLRRLSGRVNIDHKVRDGIKIGSSISLSQQRTSLSGEGAGNNNGAMVNALRRNPNLGVRNPDGSWDKNDPGAFRNPVQLAEERLNLDYQTRFVGNIYAEVKLLEGLTLRTQFSADLLNAQTRRFTPTTLQGVVTTEALHFKADDRTWVNDTYFTYVKSLGSNHVITATMGGTVQETVLSGLRASSTAGSSNSIVTVNNGAIPSVSESIGEFTIASLFGRINYDFSQKYLIGLNFRYDGSSRFGSENKFGFFPGASAAWRVSKEPFLSNSSVVSDLKLRLSWGLSGSSNGAGVDNYAFLGLLSPDPVYGTRPAVGLQRASNPNLAWEETSQTNIGIDLSLLRDRIRLTVDGYYKKSDNLFMIQQYSSQIGYSTSITNSGGMQNRGIEVVLNANVIDRPKFKWSTAVNFSYNSNEITKVPSRFVSGALRDEFIEYYNGAGAAELQPASIYLPGRPAGEFYILQFQGVNTTNGNAIYEDISGNGVQEVGLVGDRTNAGNALPLHTGGINNEFSFANIDFSFLMAWSYGNEVYNYTKQVLNALNPLRWNATTDVLRAWQEDGNVTDVPRVYYSNSPQRNFNNTASTRFLEDGSFLRVRTVTLGYTLPSSLFGKTGIRRARIYAQAQNLYVFTNYSGLDPESQNQRFQAQAQLGYDNFATPQPRTFQIGFNLSF